MSGDLSGDLSGGVSGVPGAGRAGRDRDVAGRARSARPRDVTGRPLPHGTPGVPVVPDDLVLSPDGFLDLAQSLLDDGRPFAAHEVLEAAWKQAPAGTRELFRGLAQVAVGLTHAQRGNSTGASTLLRRGADTLDASAPAHGVDPASTAAESRAAADVLDRAAAAALPVPVLPVPALPVPRLRSDGR